MKWKVFSGFVVALMFVSIVFCPVGCSWLSSPQGPQGVGLAAKDVVCVLQHDTETIAEINRDCNLLADVASLIEQILASAHANEARAARAACFPSDGGVGK